MKEIQQYNMVQLCNSSLAVKELRGYKAIVMTGYAILGRMTSVQKTSSFHYISAYGLLAVPLLNQKDICSPSDPFQYFPNGTSPHWTVELLRR